MNKFSKFLKHGKRLVAIMLVLFMNINTFATTTSNDGSAFVTKAEFDSLINNFNNQMDTYQSGLNAKIDTAIANYLGNLASETTVVMNHYLNSSGKLTSGEKLTWSSNDTMYYGSRSQERIAIERTETIWMMYAQNDRVYSDKLTFYDFDMQKIGYSDEFSVNNRKYDTSKLTKIKLDNGTQVNGMDRQKVRCNANITFMEFKSWWNSSESYSPGLSFNVGSIKQNSTLAISTGGDYWTAGAWKQANCITMETYDVKEDGEKYEVIELMCPYSTYQEMYWDPFDNTSTLANYGTSYRDRPATMGVDNRYIWPYNDTRSHNVFTNVVPRLQDGYTVNWMKKKEVVRDMYLVTLNKLSNKNRKIRNGMVLSETIGSSKYRITANADCDGTLYCYIGKNPIDNWKDASFSGEKVLLEDPGKDYQLEIETTSTEKNVPIWICFLPSDSTAIGNLKIKSLVGIN